MQLTIEVTSNCQAQCPGCIRKNVINPTTGEIGYTKGVPKNVNMTLEAHNKLIDEAYEKGLTWVSYDGGFGDSPLHPDFLDMIRHVSKKPDIQIIAISTNGSYQTEEFWFELGKILKENQPNDPEYSGDLPRMESGHLVFFDLDGVDNKTQNKYN